MQIRFKLLTATAAALLPLGAVSQSTPPTPQSPANTQAGSAPSLPQAPSAILAQQDASPLRLAGSGFHYVAAGTMRGPGGFQVEKPVDHALALSLDDAIALGIARNVRIKYERANQRLVHGYTGQIYNAIIPNLNFKAASSAQEINLAALGFKPQSLGPLLAQLGLSASSFPTIVKVNTTSVQVSMDQVLFNMPDFELLKAVKPEERSIAYTVDDTNEQIVQAVATAYLQVLADRASLNNAIAQEQAAKVLYDQAVARDQAGVGIRLDVLRAQVQYQQRQQQHVSAESQMDKDGIQLNRIMGLPAGQQLDLTDEAPFSELAELSLDQATQTAYTHRSDLLSLQSAIEVASRELKAVKYQRLPTLAVNGFYGILGLDSGPYHGVFTAQGSLKFDIFREAAQRGEEQAAGSQLLTLREQESNLKGTIDAQIRTSLLDVGSADQLVKVAQSSVDLAQQELSDARERFTAGITDDLEVVDAQATVTDAQAQLVNALYQYNVAKVNLARSTGVLQSRYRAFLGM